MRTKTILFCLLAISCYPSVIAQNWQRMGFIVGKQKTEAELQAEERKAAAALLKRRAATMVDPYRVINSQTNRIDAVRWVVFEGQVLQTLSSGTVIRGWFGPADQDGWKRIGQRYYEEDKKEFVVVNFPYQLPDGEYLPADKTFFAQPAGIHRYEVAFDGTQTLQKLDYGKVWNPPPPKPLTEEERQERQERAAQTKAAAEEKALAWNRDQAKKGDAYAQYRMGIRYLKGEGVAKDPQAAREWFAKAAKQGHTRASELKTLASQPSNQTHSDH